VVSEAGDRSAADAEDANHLTDAARSGAEVGGEPDRDADVDGESPEDDHATADPDASRPTAELPDQGISDVDSLEPAANDADPAVDDAEPAPDDTEPAVMDADRAVVDAEPAPDAELAAAPAAPRPVAALRLGTATDDDPRDVVPPVIRDSPARRARKAKRARQRVRRRIRAGLLIFAGCLLLGGVWVGFRTYQAYGELRDSAALVSTLQDQIGNADRRAASATLDTLQQHTGAAAGAVGDPLYRLASTLPWVGPNLDAISEIARTSDELADQVLPDLVGVADRLDPADFAPRNGVVDVSGLAQAATDLNGTRATIDAARQRLASIDRSAVTGPVSSATVRLWGELDGLSDLTATGSRAATLVPAMLGANGPRTYLLVSQNLAEPRATGGLFGSFAVLGADQGRISLGDSGSVSRKIGVVDPPLTGLPTSLTDLYSDRITSIAVDANFTPDFPTAASLFARMYTERTGQQVDGVIAVDPKVLSYVLTATGSVEVPNAAAAPDAEKKTITLKPSTAVKVLLSDVYRIFDEDKDAVARDEFLAKATSAVFERLMAGGGDSTKLVNAVLRSVSEHRLLVWSSDEAEQAEIEQTPLAGKLPVVDGTNPVFGVYLNDGTGAKLGYYLRSVSTVKPATCRADGRQEWLLSVKLTYSAPATGLPEYVLGLKAAGEPYVLRTNVTAVGPSAGGISGVDRDGVPTWMQSGRESDRAAGIVTVDLAPGASTDLTFQMFTDPVVGAAPGTYFGPEIRTTPGIGKTDVTVTKAPVCQPAT